VLVDSDVLEARAINSMGTGLVSGGILSINTDTTKFDISAGKGVVINEADPDVPVVYNVSWTAFSAQTVTNLATSPVSYISIDSSGAITQSTTAPVASDGQLSIFIGQLGHSNNSTISTAVITPTIFNNGTNLIRAVTESLGVLGTGCIVSANGANLSIDMSSGTLIKEGINYAAATTAKHTKAFSAQVPATIRRRTQTGNGDTNTVLDVGFYDNAGTKTSVAPNKYTNQRVYLVSSGNIVVQYGQTIYNSMSEATSAINSETFVLLNNLKENAKLIGVVSVRSNGTDLSAAADAVFTPPRGVVGGSAIAPVSDHGLLAGLTDDDHTQYSLVSDGAGAPATTPSRVGAVYIDTTGDVTYVATGTASSADWDAISVVGHTHTESDISDLGAYITDVTGDNLSALADVTVTTGAQGDVLYRNASAWVNLAPGTSGQFLKTNGAAANPAWATPAGSGDVSKVGTPVANQVGQWTGDGTIKGAADLTFDGSDFVVREAVNDGDPSIQLGASASEQLHISSLYATGTQTLETVTIHTETESATANYGAIAFNIDGAVSDQLTINDAGISVEGAISVTGTVDGRDIATDGTTLDDIPVGNLADGTAGQLITWSAAGAPTTVAVGTATHVLTSNGVGAAPTFQASAAGFADPMTTRGDIIYKNAAGTTTRLAAGTVGQVLTSDGTDISWDTAAGGGDALVANPLSQFAATTSAQLAGVISDETGSGLLVFGTSPTFITPVLGTPTSGVATNLTGTAAGLTAGAVSTITGLAPDTATTAAAQPNITSLGTLTTLTVDDITINGNTISSGGASTLAITPTAGQAITLDGTITVDAGVVAGATSITSTAFVGDLTGNADTVTTNANLSGDVTSSGSNVTTIAANAVDLSMMAQMATDSFLGRTTAATGNVEVLSKSAALTILNVADGADVTSANETSHADVVVDSDFGTNVATFLATPSTANFLAAVTDETFVMDSDINSTVQAYSANLGDNLGQQTIWVPANAMVPTTTNGAAAATEEMPTNDVMVSTLLFDAATDEFACFQIQMPKSWNESTGIVAQFVWKAGATSGNCIWGIQAVAFADSDPLDTAFGTAQTATDAAVSPADDVLISSETSAITVAGTPGAEEFVVFKVYRDANAAGDTMTGDAELLGVKLHYTVDAGRDD
jgi:hypothetical protein